MNKSRLIVKHRDLVQEELKQQNKRLKTLGPQEEEEEEEEIEPVEGKRRLPTSCYFPYFAVFSPTFSHFYCFCALCSLYQAIFICLNLKLGNKEGGRVL